MYGHLKEKVICCIEINNQSLIICLAVWSFMHTRFATIFFSMCPVVKSEILLLMSSSAKLVLTNYIHQYIHHPITDSTVGVANHLSQVTAYYPPTPLNLKLHHHEKKNNLILVLTMVVERECTWIDPSLHYAQV